MHAFLFLENVPVSPAILSQEEGEAKDG